jgi:hypothetical protein
MKTIITTLLLLITLIGKSQNYPKINIWTLEKDTVYAGDSLWLGVKVVPPSVPTNTYSLFQIQLPNYDIIWTGNYQTILTCPTYTYNVKDILYKKYITIPTFATLGNNKIYASGGSNKAIYIKSKQVATSIEELTKNDIVSVKYYDIYGKEKPSLSEGLTIMITTYSNGYQKKQKVILSLQ